MTCVTTPSMAEQHTTADHSKHLTTDNTTCTWLAKHTVPYPSTEQDPPLGQAWLVIHALVCLRELLVSVEL